MEEYSLSPSVGKLQEFYSWLINIRRISEQTAKDYIRYIQRPLDLNNRHSVYAYRLYLRFEGREIPSWMKPTKRSGIDLHVPSEKEVAQSIVFLKNLTGVKHDYLQVYLLLLASGIRLSEAQFFIENLPRWEHVEKDGIRYYVVNWQRGNKAVFYIFTPTWLRLRQEKVSWENKGPHRDVPVKPKYLRKFFATKCFELGIPSEIIDFLQGRTPRSILAQHYLNLLPRTVEEYRKYVGWLRGFLSQTGVME